MLAGTSSSLRRLRAAASLGLPCVLGAASAWAVCGQGPAAAALPVGLALVLASFGAWRGGGGRALQAWRATLIEHLAGFTRAVSMDTARNRLDHGFERLSASLHAHGAPRVVGDALYFGDVRINGRTDEVDGIGV